jgi:hypothetical protein
MSTGPNIPKDSKIPKDQNIIKDPNIRKDPNTFLIIFEIDVFPQYETK